MPKVTDKSANHYSQKYPLWFLAGLWVSFAVFMIFDHNGKLPWYGHTSFWLVGFILAIRTTDDLFPNRLKKIVLALIFTVMAAIFGSKIYLNLQLYGLENVLPWMATNWYFILAILWLPAMLLGWIFFERQSAKVKIKE